jgi:iron complex transport system permease protein
MKITLDLDMLVAEGKLTVAEAERLKGFAAKDTGELGSNVLFALGAAAVAIGVGVLVPTVETAIALGAVLFGVGFWLRVTRVARWNVFAQIIMVIGALALLGGLGGLFGEHLWVRVVLTAATAVAAVLATSGLLASLAVLAFAATITLDVDIWAPTHYLSVAIVALSALVLGLYLLSLRLAPAHERLAIIAMRTAILLVNGAFFIGSIFGDELLGLPGLYFSVAWAIALLAFGAWAVFANRRWVVNTVAVFGALHFFTQWFMALGAQPFSILGGGLLLIGFGLALARFNRWVGARKAPASPGSPLPQADGWKE